MRVSVLCVKCTDGAKRASKNPLKPLSFRGLSMVEATGFEPAASWSRTKRATKLRYASTVGANVGTRTPDLRITSALLYQLSYIGMPDDHRL